MPIHQHSAGAADPVLAAHMGAGEAEIMAQEISQMAPHIDGAREGGAIHLEFDGACERRCHWRAARPQAFSRARRIITPARRLR